MSCKIKILLTADKYALQVEILQISLTSQNITGKNHHQQKKRNTFARVFFSINFQASALWILQNFKKHLFLKNTSGGCFLATDGFFDFSGFLAASYFKLQYYITYF